MITAGGDVCGLQRRGFVVWLILRVCERRWFSVKISRCQRDAPGSIPGRRILYAALRDGC